MLRHNDNHNLSKTCCTLYIDEAEWLTYVLDLGQGGGNR